MWGQLLLCPEGMLILALHLPGGPMDLLGELAVFIVARRVKPALKAIKRGKLSHGVQRRQQVSVWVPEPLSLSPAHVTSSHAGKGKLISRSFTCPGLLSLAGDMLAQTPCHPTDPAIPQHPQVCEKPEEMLCDPG